MPAPRVAIFLGSQSDVAVAEPTRRVLRELEIPHSLHIASAHRTPELLQQRVKDSPAQVLIGVAGAAAALPGALAALTTRPVIGVPVGGNVPYDSLLSIAQVPPGVPVATVGVDGGENAALLAAAILAVSDERIQAALAAYREKARREILAADEALQREEKK